MKEGFVEEATLSQAYHAALLTLQKYGEEADCADWEQKQKELSMTIIIDEPLQEPMISKYFIGGPEALEQYRQEMLDGILDFEVEKGNWAYTYHDRMVNYPMTWKTTYSLDTHTIITDNSINQIDFVINELKRNPSSRRAVVLVRDPSVDTNSDDPACLQHIQYFIRNNKLHCKVLFRSNDACKASFMNMFALIMLQKRIADELGIELGTYVHRANSYHCYEKDYEMLKNYTDAITEAVNLGEKNQIALAFNYKDGWDELMEEFKPDIEKKVKELKER